MRKRDLTILNDLQRFRCLSKDDIIDLHFSDLKQPITCCNTVLKRLRRDGYIEVNTNHQPFIYFPAPTGIKKGSAKIPHFLKIVEFYKSLLTYEKPKSFIVEPKYGKKGNYMEPDAFTICKRGPFFIEIQPSVYSDKVMKEKISQYEAYFMNNEWKQEPWRHENKKIFASVVVITDTRYNFASPYIQFIQIQSIDQLVNMFEPKANQIINKSTGLKLVQ